MKFLSAALVVFLFTIPKPASANSLERLMLACLGEGKQAWEPSSADDTEPRTRHPHEIIRRTRFDARQVLAYDLAFEYASRNFGNGPDFWVRFALANAISGGVQLKPIATVYDAAFDPKGLDAGFQEAYAVAVSVYVSHPERATDAARFFYSWRKRVGPQERDTASAIAALSKDLTPGEQSREVFEIRDGKN